MPAGTDESQRHEGAVTVNVRFFARYAELVGTEGLIVTVPAPATVQRAAGLVRAQLPNGRALPERPMIAVNERHALPEDELKDGDIVAFLPPLAGG